MTLFITRLLLVATLSALALSACGSDDTEEPRVSALPTREQVGAATAKFSRRTNGHSPGGSKRGRACTCAKRRPARGTARCNINGGRTHPITYSGRSVSGRPPSETERRRYLAGGVRDILRSGSELHPRRVGTDTTGLRAGLSAPERGHDRAVGGNDFPVPGAGCSAQPNALLPVSLSPARRD